jgi:hypothetical protein
MEPICNKYNFNPAKTRFVDLKDNLELKEDIVSLIYDLLKIINNEIEREKIASLYDEASDFFKQSATDNFVFSFESPLIGKVNDVYLKNMTDDYYNEKEEIYKFKYLSNDFLEKFNILEKDRKKRKDLVKKILSSSFAKKEDSNVIVSSSGMCHEGSVLSLLEKHLPDEKATLVLSGFQASDTNGFLLKNLLDNKYDDNNEKEKRKIEFGKGEDIYLSEIKCKIVDMSSYYSGHADQEQLVDYVTDSRNSGKITVLLNHGSDSSRKELKTKIEERNVNNANIKVILPEFNKWFNVITNEHEVTEEIIPDDIENRKLNFIQIEDIHIYYPDEDKEKIDSFIARLQE